MVKKICTKIVFYVASLATIVAGLLYLVMTDIAFGNTSQWLLSVAVCAFGSGICMLLSASFKEKKTLCYVLKAIAVVLAAGLSTILFVSKAFPPFSELAPSLVNGAEATVTFTAVLAVVGAVFCLADVLLTLFLRSDDEE